MGWNNINCRSELFAGVLFYLATPKRAKYNIAKVTYCNEGDAQLFSLVQICFLWLSWLFLKNQFVACLEKRKGNWYLNWTYLVLLMDSSFFVKFCARLPSSWTKFCRLCKTRRPLLVLHAWLTTVLMDPHSSWHPRHHHHSGALAREARAAEHHG